MLITVGLVSAVCIGVLAASARTPKLRPVPMIAACLLALGLAVALVTLEAGNLLLGFSCLILFIVAMATYDAIVWRAVLGKAELPFATALIQSIFGAKYLRARYTGMKAYDADVVADS